MNKLILNNIRKNMEVMGQIIQFIILIIINNKIPNKIFKIISQSQIIKISHNYKVLIESVISKMIASLKLKINNKYKLTTILMNTKY